MSGAVSKRDIHQCLTRDQYRLGRKLSRLRGERKRGRDISQPMQALQQEVSRSRDRAEQRRRSLPTVEFPGELPISSRRDDIAAALEQHQVIVVAGETGSGKTTQLPKLCLEMGYGARGLIGHTQPRRLAARSVASRIAEELDEPLGRGIGYQVRFADQSSDATWVKLMTDGILLAEIQQDRFLNDYEVLIVDEAHERSLNIDFLLGYLKRLVRRRPNLKVIITSATIDVDKFAAHFDDAPVISVSGRTYPVDVLYRDGKELEQQASEQGEDWLVHGVRSALETIEDLDRQRGKGPGDVLVFLSGEREIRELAAALRRSCDSGTQILPLYARLGQAEQRRVFESHRGRRIILSTNVAETSLTVPGIVYVIDSGLARISRYSVQSKVQRLPIERISRASADQRAGRCGRVTAGTCIRLYSEEDYLSRPEFTDPEIQRTNLSSVILQMLMLGLGDIERFPFVEPPDQRSINDGYRLLHELGAIDAQRRITAVGRAMARIPADPRLARMLIEADRRHCLHEMLIIVSALSIQDPRETPAEQREAARQCHRRHAHPRSDFLSFVQLFELYETQRQSLSQNQLRRFCRENFLSFMRMREWRETHRQLLLACEQQGLRQGRRRHDELDYEGIHRAILAGSLNQVGARTDNRRYTGSRGRVFSLFPGSTLASSPPRWVVTAELIETSRLFATLAAAVEPEWIVEAAGELVRRDYFEPHWEKKRGEVVAFEKVSLFGLTLIEKRRVSYGTIDPAVSREIFIREALVPMALKSDCGFLQHNRELIDSIRREEEKLRRPDILADEQTLIDFYEARLPAHVRDTASLRQWCRNDPRADASLRMQREDVVQRQPDETLQRNFPDHAHIQHNRLAIHYRFQPGSDDDGAAIDVPASMLDAVTEVDLDWAIPGQVAERCEELLRGLPKSLRKQFIPVPEFVRKALANAGDQRKPLKRLLREQAQRLRGIEIDPALLERVELPPHLRPTIRVTDDSGQRELDRDASLEALRERLEMPAAETRPPARHPLERSGVTDWDFGELPAEVHVGEQVTLQRYPALQDDGDSVSIVLAESMQEAVRRHRDGLSRLLICRTGQQKQMIQRKLKQLRQDLGLRFPGQLKDFETQSLLAIYRHAFAVDSGQVRDRAAFETMLEQGRPRLMEEAERMIRTLHNTLLSVFEINRRLSELDEAGLRDAAEDMRRQLAWLVNEHFPGDVPASRLGDYPRYFKAMNARIDRLRRDPERDREGIAIIRRLSERYRQLTQQHDDDELAELADFPWMLQELRISLFAQPMKTRMPVSEKRLQKKLEKL